MGIERATFLFDEEFKAYKNMEKCKSKRTC